MNDDELLKEIGATRGISIQRNYSPDLPEGTERLEGDPVPISIGEHSFVVEMFERLIARIEKLEKR